MIDLLSKIVNAIIIAFQFLINIITSFVSLFTAIPKFILLITNTIVSFPNILIPFFLTTISIYVLLLILGRNN